MNTLILFPHQLFEDAMRRSRGNRVVLIEHPLFFTQFKFHKQKLVLHRASMKEFADRLTRENIAVKYVDIDSFTTIGDALKSNNEVSHGKVYVYDLVDDWLMRDVRKSLKQVEVLPTPMFLTQREQIDQFFQGKRSYRMADFYTFQRRRLGILVDRRGNPDGGRWSFDAENRKRLPKQIELPEVHSFAPTDHVKDAVAWVDKRFPDNYGSLDYFNYPVTHRQARELLAGFIQNSFANFGAYEDAISVSETRLFHSCLTSSLNTGLLTPQEVLDAALSAENIPLNSLEGFVRQIIGWREFVRAVYEMRGRAQRTTNFFRFTKPVPDAFWTGELGLTPADIVIKRVLENAYCHHIERLMVLGSLMMMCEIDPDQVYEWFMTLFIDAYDWVMVPNVYGMSQFADSGLMTTKPYLSGSAYLKKMSDFASDPWCAEWDALYWRFIDCHREAFEGNQRTNFSVITLDRMAKEKRKQYSDIAELLFERLWPE